MLDWYGGPFDPSSLDEARARFSMENMVRRGAARLPATEADRGVQSNDEHASSGTLQLTLALR